jgi:hypothetical protein
VPQLAADALVAADDGGNVPKLVPIAADHDLIDRWQRAVERLRSDADAVLPGSEL